MSEDSWALNLSTAHLSRDPNRSADQPHRTLWEKSNLTELGIEHEFVEVKAAHCEFDWDGAALRFMSEHLIFDTD